MQTRVQHIPHCPSPKGFFIGRPLTIFLLTRRDLVTLTQGNSDSGLLIKIQLGYLMVNSLTTRRLTFQRWIVKMGTLHAQRWRMVYIVARAGQMRYTGKIAGGETSHNKVSMFQDFPPNRNHKVSSKYYCSFKTFTSVVQYFNVSRLWKIGARGVLEEE